ncbi:S9 family peptidase, partial [bacterium]|nr:S9 family peptidase [bacterium]
WKTISVEEKGLRVTGDLSGPSTAYLAVYIQTQRWTQAEISLKTSQLAQIYMDGNLVATKKNFQPPEMVTSPLSLETGKHLMIIKSVFNPRQNSNWSIQASLLVKKRYLHPPPMFSLSPIQHMSLSHLLDTPRIEEVSLSPDGSLAALIIEKYHPPTNSTKKWTKIFNTETGKLFQTYKGGTSISEVNWAPHKKIFSYTQKTESGETLWVVNLETGTSRPLLQGIKNLGPHVWSPDGSFIVYSVTQKHKPSIKGFKRFQNLEDRQPWWRDKRYLYKVNLQDGVRQRLTAGSLTTVHHSLSPDGRKLLFTRSIPDYSQRPSSLTELYSLDLENLNSQRLWKGKWFQKALWSPHGEKLLILGGPSTFGDKGTNLPKRIIPNEYDTQAFLFELETQKIKPLTKNFKPSINEAQWSRKNEFIYFLVTDKSYRRLYRYDPQKEEFSLLPSKVEVVQDFDLARTKPVILYSGSSASVPSRSYVMDLRNKKVRMLHQPAKKEFSSVRLGEVQRWTFKNKKGVEMEGRVYYPPEFDPSQKYPCIVYYYGGTTPVTRRFGGRYPKNLYAAQGYIVYVLQPSGAVGFGQRFSAYHVNDWGEKAGKEIIKGVKKFLKDHPFVDSKRIGCIGASYGGFMTMYLLTQTNLFTTGIAHAGISSISSYWGEGYWGYSYSAIASAQSFPWNRKDIYVNQSPLFNADKISTPLLLLHGSVDTNVPPGESAQLFTALKILGQEVEYIQISDQNHHIMNYRKRKIWTQTILAWFDRWLKGQPEWWAALYPQK